MKRRVTVSNYCVKRTYGNFIVHFIPQHVLSSQISFAQSSSLEHLGPFCKHPVGVGTLLDRQSGGFCFSCKLKHLLQNILHFKKFLFLWHVMSNIVICQMTQIFSEFTLEIYLAQLSGSLYPRSIGTIILLK